MANLHCIETRAFLEGADKVVIPFGIWEHNEGISRYRNRVKAVCGSKKLWPYWGDVEIDRREIRIAEKEKKAVQIGVYDYTEDEVYEDGFNFGYYCIIESMVHLIQRKIWSEVEHNQIRYESAEIICKYWYPEIEDDELQIITICMCALMYDNPGVDFFATIVLPQVAPSGALRIAPLAFKKRPVQLPKMKKNAGLKINIS